MAKTYGTYKDSGIAWIGEIPGEWEVKRLGNFYNQRNEKVSDKDFAPLSVTMKGIVPQLETAAKTNDGDNRKLVRKGDFAINSRSDRRGSCGISNYDGSVSLINTVLCPKGEMDAGYYNWLFHTSMFADEYYKWGHGIVDDLWTTRWSEMKNIEVVNPPLSAQQSISSFLDTKCGEIDSLISIQEEMISELLAYKQSVITEAVTKGLDKKAKMKNSGVEWIGDIPEEWEVRRIKNICIMGPTDDYSHPYESVGYAPMNTIRYGNINAGIIEKSKLSSGLTYFADNDIVMAKVTPCFENGNIAIAKNLHNGCAYGSSELFVFRATNILTEFLFYLLQNEKFKGLCCSTMTGTGGLKRVSPSFVYNSFIPLPPLPVQQAIATYLDEKTSQIDSLIALKQSKIESLKEYKKSIIYEYVTGKKRV